ncbi:ETC complex I subunit [Acetobacter sp. DsW_063]|uniref:ETC complex I subunit n=1 Tax=Acetobacter sp. DsW_063 TaxID=1514894 RepID=UPI000A3BC4D7|nr:ETC complex I subunit [Acetobacter sp. DsW_063]OUJ13003.1 hypothetical protein HK28_02415 [Acetobacter sp. DsW_063]
MTARIYRQPKSAGQSGQSQTHTWILEYGQSSPHRPGGLMGWTGSRDTRSQLRLKFGSRDEALGYAQLHAIAYELEEPAPSRARKPKVYADNFASGRVQNWTH